MRERETETDRQRERGREGERESLCERAFAPRRVDGREVHPHSRRAAKARSPRRRRL